MLKSTLRHIRAAVHRRFGIQPLSKSIPGLRQWYQGPLGQALLAEEQEQIDRVVNYLYGYHLMQLSVSPELDLSRNSTINHRFGFSPSLAENNADFSSDSDVDVIIEPVTAESKKTKTENILNGFADPERIPLGSESIDVAVLHHVLDFTENPHNVLRETARVLIPRGYVVIVGFNPLGCFGLWKWFARIFTQRPQWRHRSLRLRRVVDWLRLLDFEPVEIAHGYFRIPIDSQRFLNRTVWYERFMKKTRLPLGGFYLILARKDVVAMTPLKPEWKKYSAMKGLVGNQNRSSIDSPCDTNRGDVH